MTTSEVTTFGYDPTGLVSRLTDGRGNTALYQNNSWGLTDTAIETQRLLNRDCLTVHGRQGSMPRAGRCLRCSQAAST